MAHRLAEINGFVALDEINRYEIRFPKPADPKPPDVKGIITTPDGQK